MAIEKRWVVENGEGHWELHYNGATITCDPGEVAEAIEELKAMT